MNPLLKQSPFYLLLVLILFSCHERKSSIKEAKSNSEVSTKSSTNEGDGNKNYYSVPDIPSPPLSKKQGQTSSRKGRDKLSLEQERIDESTV